MKQIVILGAGTAGTMMANHLKRKLDLRHHAITIVDQHATHYYQPGFLFLPFGMYRPDMVKKPKAQFLPSSVRFVQERIEVIEAESQQVALANGEKLPYDVLIIATGCRTVPSETPGLEGEEWGRSIGDFYTFEGAVALRDQLAQFRGGRLTIHMAEMPIKCPVAPLEFAFLADAYLTRRGLRKQTQLLYVTPLAGAFTKVQCNKVLGHMFRERNIEIVTDFGVSEVAAQDRQLVSYDGRTVDYDLLVTVPVNMGDPVIERSGLGDELNYVPTHPHTLQSKAHENIFVIGDATDLPSSKAGSVAHFQSEILTENIVHYLRGKEVLPHFDGHANCFIETGYGKAILIDFNYDYEPVAGRFPLPVVGPFALLRESRINHWGKLAFRWIYWDMLLRGIPLPLVSARMSLSGKQLPAPAKQET